jgi:alkylated DNA repair dioxygenase AlkB
MPQYTYARIYKNGSDLKIHTDRPECQYSVTLCLGGEYEKPWPIWIKDYSGKSHEVPLDEGDCVVYHGTELEHWRDKFEGEMQYQLFMHYVDSEGKYKDRVFDGRPNLGLKQ